VGFCEEWILGADFMAHRDTPNLPTPDFTFDLDATGACIAGVRPYRNSSYRLEAETISNRFFVHNYGHGVPASP
jgi:hypothetical protein